MFYEPLCVKLDLNSRQKKGFIDQIQLIQSEDWIAEEQRRKNVFENLPQFEPKITTQLKMEFRQGIPEDQRRKWWFIASGGLELMASTETAGAAYQLALKKIKNEEFHESFFGGAINILNFLSPKIAKECKTFLHVVWSQNKRIEFSPLIPTVSILLLMYLEPPLAYLAIQAMINRSYDDMWYFTLTRDHFLASIEAFRSLVHRSFRKIEFKCTSLGLDVAQIGIALFPVFFLPFTPLHVALTLFDSYINEGRKIPIRVALTLFQSEEDLLLEAKTSNEFLNILIHGMDKLANVKSTQRFLFNSFHRFLSRGSHINKYEKSAIKDKRGVMSSSICKSAASFQSMLNDNVFSVLTPQRRFSDPSLSDSSDEIIALEDTKPGLIIPTNIDLKEMENEQKKLQKQLAESSAPTVINGKLLTQELYYSLRSLLPVSMRSYYAKKVFSITEDGTLFRTLFEKQTKKAPCILMIKTKTQLVGAFLSDPLNPDISSRGRFYGRPINFVFKCNPLMVFKCNEVVNTMFQSVTSDTISIGGPRAAIFIQDGFRHMISEKCETFGSPSFTTSETDYPILNVELYQLLIPSQN